MGQQKNEKNPETALISAGMRTQTDTNRKKNPNSEIFAKSNTEGTELNLLRC